MEHFSKTSLCVLRIVSLAPSRSFSFTTYLWFVFNMRHACKVEIDVASMPLEYVEISLHSRNFSIDVWKRGHEAEVFQQDDDLRVAKEVSLEVPERYIDIRRSIFDANMKQHGQYAIRSIVRGW